VHWRQSLARGSSEEEILRDGRLLKSLRTERIEEELIRQHGASAFVPRGDVDRPFTPSELRDFSARPWVQLGNHTSNHGILTNYPLSEALGQIVAAQEAIESMTGKRAISLAYPNGNHSPDIERLCEKAGIQCAFTVAPSKTALPITPSTPNLMQIGRFMPDSQASLERQFRTFRSDAQLCGRFHRAYERFAHRRANSTAVIDDEPVLVN
jgi:peptidoglycan/xylan/chitin deacetylase (PgdA/CDA1 family)